MAYVLIVDDDDDFSNALSIVLKNAGHETAVAPSATRASERVKEKKPDLVILDVMFPESDSGGFEFMQHLRSCPGDLGQTPVLMLTAINSKFPVGFETTADGVDAPMAEEFLEKPVDFGVLLSKVAGLLSRPERI